MEKRPITKLIEAIIKNDENEVAQLLMQGVDPNSYEDDLQIRPLHFAVQYGAYESCQQLLKAGADVHAKRADGETIESIAKIYGHEHILRLFEEKKENAQAQDQKKCAMRFSQRESECTTQAIQGKNVAQIAESLGLSQQSVYFYLRNIIKKFSVLAIATTLG